MQPSDSIGGRSHQFDSHPTPESQTLTLSRFSGFVSYNGPSASRPIEPPIPSAHPCLSSTNEDVLLKRFQFYLQNLPKHQLAHCLSRLTGGRCVNSDWFGSSGNSIYLRSITNSVHKISVRSPPISFPPLAVGFPLVEKAVADAVKPVLSSTGDHDCHHRVAEAALEDAPYSMLAPPNGDNAAGLGKGRVATFGNSATVSHSLVNVRFPLFHVPVA